MTNADDQEVKDVERVEIEPTTDDEIVESQESSTETEDESNEESETEETEEATEETEESEEESEIEPEKKDVVENTNDEHGNLKRLPDETPREFALRIQVTNLRSKLRGERKQEFFEVKPVQNQTVKNEEFLKKYKPEDIAAFNELAKNLGYVQQGEIAQSTFEEKSAVEFDKFIEKHPEYAADNDPENVLWDRLKEEFALYAQPKNPKDYGKILERAHQAVFNIQPISKLKNNSAAKEKIKVASHSSASRSTEGLVTRKSVGTQGLRTDMLKGFSDDEKAELED